MKTTIPYFLAVFAQVGIALGQTSRHIPKPLGDQLSYDSNGVLRLSKEGESLPALGTKDKWVLSDFLGKAAGAETGIALDFGKPDFNGTVAYGPYVETSKYPFITYNPKAVKIQSGRALMEMKTVFTGAADFFKFSEKGKGIVGYRVIDETGRLLYEGRVAFAGKGPYQVLPTVIEGPLVNLLRPDGCTISFETSEAVKASITVDGRQFGDTEAGTHHEIALSGLKPETAYDYLIAYGDRTDTHRFRTALPDGSRKPFTFGFTADQRAVTGGGEHDLSGVDYSAARASMAAATVLNGASFMVAMGGQTTGNNPTVGGHMLEHANWKRALEPFWSQIPVYPAMGNHEADYIPFALDKKGKATRIASFPYDTDSGEAVFAKAFVLPENGPVSEGEDFPPYKENVYYYTYGNLAMVVLNSEYWKSVNPLVNGAPEGYVMDRQLKWLDETIQKLERDSKIDHIFVNLHSCVFPDGDHSDAGMWFGGSNDPRPMVAGVKAQKGIIERRDELIDVAINRSKKVIGFLVGSEHNFALLKVTPDLPIYPANWSLPKMKIKRDFVYINSGAGGTYAYALLYNTPWADKFQYFTVPPALSLFTVNGKSVTVKLINPENFEIFCENVKLR